MGRDIPVTSYLPIQYPRYALTLLRMELLHASGNLESNISCSITFHYSKFSINIFTTTPYAECPNDLQSCVDDIQGYAALRNVLTSLDTDTDNVITYKEAVSASRVSVVEQLTNKQRRFDSLMSGEAEPSLGADALWQKWTASKRS